MPLRNLAFFAVALFAVALAGCLGSFHVVEPDMGGLRSRASFDLQCKEIEEHSGIAPRTWMVRGCHKEAIYVHTCQTCSHDTYGSCEGNCAWLLNGAPRASAATASTAPAP